MKHSACMGSFLMERIFRSTPNGVLMVHSEWWLPRVETEAFNTTCAVYGEDYECWWLSGGDSSVVRALAAQVRGPGFDSRQASFSLFSPSPQNKPPVFTHTQSNISYTSIATKKVVDSSVQLNGCVRAQHTAKYLCFFLLLLLLLGTNCTCKFFLGVIRWTRYSCAGGFNMMEQLMHH